MTCREYKWVPCTSEHIQTAKERQIVRMDDCIHAEVKKLRSMVDELKKTQNDRSMVAFSAALRPPSCVPMAYGYGNTGPSTSATTLIFSELITNIGDGYNPYTGVFTAPKRGVYYFTFTMYGWCNEKQVGAAMYNDDKEILFAWLGAKKGSNEDFATNAVILQLEKGKTVYMRLPEGLQITSRNCSNVTTFSGFLLNPM
uniref:C1q domain-containing protein n=1 Tax=Hucho hucho TaxID=62062 RepID=A0A4W5RJD3_9TELE